jgi:hypothetical protein
VNDETIDAPAWDGLPPNPDQTGWHWLCYKSDGRLSPWHWTDEDGGPGDFGWSTDGDTGPGAMASQFRYVAPCVPPATVEGAT